VAGRLEVVQRVLAAAAAAAAAVVVVHPTRMLPPSSSVPKPLVKAALSLSVHPPGQSQTLVVNPGYKVSG
jgi:hypothetical protein